MARDWDNKVKVDLNDPDKRHFPEPVGDGAAMAKAGYQTLDQLKPEHSKERKGNGYRDAVYPTRY